MPPDHVPPTPSLRRRTIFAGSWSLAALLTAQATRLGGNLIMARLLMPEMFGIMLIATTVSVVLTLLSDIGLRQNIIQSKRGNDPLFLNTAWTVQILRGFALFVFSLLIAALAWYAQTTNLWPADSTYASPELPLVLAVTGFSAIINGLQSTKVAVAFRNLEQKKVVLSEFFSQILGLLVMLTIGYFTGSIWSLVTAGIVSAITSTALGHIWFKGTRNRLQWDDSALKELIAFGRWILLSSAIGVLATQGDRIWFGGSMSATELGIYSISALILGAIQTAALRLSGAVALPAFSEAVRSGDASRLRNLYYRFRLIIDIALLYTCGLLFTASPLIIDCLYDERYVSAGSMLAILSLSLFTLRFAIAHQAWIALGLTKYQAFDNIIRFASLWIALPLLLAIGGTQYAIWGVALHTFPTLILIYIVNRKLGLINAWRELIVLPFFAFGAFSGMALTRVFTI